MRYGAFVQLWATYYGDGRAMAFTDSTVFSNFCIYQPGKAELMLGMIEWLNCDNPPVHPRLWLNLLGTGMLLALVWFVMRCGFREEFFVCFIAAGMAGWIGACGMTAMLHRVNMPLPEAKKEKQMLRVVIDRTASNVPLSMGAYTKGENGSGYGLLEQWISRLTIDGRGCYTIRQQKEASFSGDALTILCPTQPVSEDFRNKLVDYVEKGGKLLVFDSPESKSSTANELLSPFKIQIEHKNAITGSLTIKDRWPGVPVEKAYQVSGGTAIARIGGKPVAAVAHSGKGIVMAVGFGSLFNDRNMGGTWTSEPDAAAKRRFNVFFALIRALLQNREVEPTQEAFGNLPEADISPNLPGKTIQPPPLDLPELPTQELGPKE
jgi:hypothetical protein